MVLSSVGPWVLGVIMNTLGSTSSWYRNAIYFYLHFQYNGWFIIAIFGMLFFVFEKHSIHITKKAFNQIFWLFNTGVILTFFLSVLWMKPHPVYYVIAGIGGLFQVLAFGILIKNILQNKEFIKTSFSIIEGLLFKTVAFLFAIKLIIQLLGAIPRIAHIVSTNIEFVIGYLHWVFLGFISISLFVFLHHFKLILISKKTFTIYFIAFILTETLIFYKGVIAWLGGSLFDNYFTFLFLSSALFLIPIFGLFFIIPKPRKVT
jgi:hypothetical protein